jgi:hypothetical protein
MKACPPAASAAAASARPGKDIWLFGGGLPLLPAPAPAIPLTLDRQRHYPKSGIMLLEYQVGRAS